MKAKASTPAKLLEYGKDGEELPSWHAKLQATPKRSFILKLQTAQKAPKGSVGVLLAAKPKTEGVKAKTGLLRSQMRATGPRGQLASADELEVEAELKTGGAEAIAEPEAKARPKTGGAEAIAEPEPKGKAKGKGK